MINMCVLINKYEYKYKVLKFFLSFLFFILLFFFFIFFLFLHNFIYETIYNFIEFLFLSKLPKTLIYCSDILL